MKSFLNFNKILIIILFLIATNSFATAENLLIGSAHQNTIYSSKTYTEGLNYFGIGDFVYIVLDNLVENDNTTNNLVKNGETVNAQVVQLLSNGNLLIQGKKTVINNDERTNLIITGIVNPKSITKSKQILSKNISNIKISFLNNSNISQESSFINKLIKHLL